MSTAMARGGDDMVDRYLPAAEPASTEAEVVNLDDYRSAAEGGMYVPASAEHAAEVEPAGEEPTEIDDEPTEPQRTGPEAPEGVTWRVRLARRGSAVQQRLSEIPARQVIRRGARAERAAEMEELAGDPRAEAYSNRRARFWLLLMAGLGIALGVGISSSTAQQTITSFMGWDPSGVAGIAAYGADPALGLVLFATLGARILASARGVAVPEVARRALNKIELVLFSLVALLNAGPSLGHLIGDAFSGEWARLGLDVMVLVIHTLGPVLVATGVFGVPYMALILGEITAATNAKRAARTAGVTPPACSENAAAGEAAEETSSKDRKRFEQIRDELAELIAAGRWNRNVSVPEIRKYFGCGVDIARDVRDALKPTE